MENTATCSVNEKGQGSGKLHPSDLESNTVFVLELEGNATDFLSDNFVGLNPSGSRRKTATSAVYLNIRTCGCLRVHVELHASVGIAQVLQAHTPMTFALFSCNDVA